MCAYMQRYMCVLTCKGIFVLTCKGICVLTCECICVLTCKGKCVLTCKGIRVLTCECKCVLTCKGICVLTCTRNGNAVLTQEESWLASKTQPNGEGCVLKLRTVKRKGMIEEDEFDRAVATSTILVTIVQTCTHLHTRTGP